jgi:hypothetical protein
MKTTLNINLKTIILIIIVILMIIGGGFGWLGDSLKKTNNYLEEQKNLTNALNDNIKKTTNKLGEIVSDKKTLQTDVDYLIDLNKDLNGNQKELVQRIESLDYKNSLISAALVRTEIKLDSALMNADVTIDTTNKTITFSDKSDTLTYDLLIGNVLPTSFGKPSLFVKELIIPNKQFIEFHWDTDKKYKQKPVSFSISNSNPLVTTLDVDSYIIPEVNKKALKPTGMQKVWYFIDDNKKPVMVGIIGVGVGALLGTTILD